MMHKISPDQVVKLVKSAEEGDVAAQAWVGVAHFKGDHLGYDLLKAESWLRKAAAAGNLDALFGLAKLLIHKSDLTGFDILEELNGSGFMPATHELGCYYYSGKIVDKDKARARLLWSQAASKGHLISRLNLSRAKSIIWRILLLPVILYGIFKILKLEASDPYDHRIMGSR